MKIVQPYACILTEGIGALQHIEWCGRISHRSEDQQTDDSWQRFIETVVMGHGDWSIVEHATVTVDALVDRGVTHEWVRHRLFSYTQESTRFVNYAKQKDGKPQNPASFIYPKPDVVCPLCESGNELEPHPDNPNCLMHGAEACTYDYVWLNAIKCAEEYYKYLIVNGWRPQEARSVLPNALASRLIVTGNLRNWRHFFIMRTTAEAHPQMRQVTIPLLKEFQQSFPLLFDDIVPLSRQVYNLKLPR